jgi:hypothetical protein
LDSRKISRRLLKFAARLSGLIALMSQNDQMIPANVRPHAGPVTNRKIFELTPENCVRFQWKSHLGIRELFTRSVSRMETICMERARIVGIALCGLGIGLTGCASDQARYVYQDRESGVVAIPKNTPKMMAYAEALMERHFPGKNYDIDDGFAWTPW